MNTVKFRRHIGSGDDNQVTGKGLVVIAARGHHLTVNAMRVKDAQQIRVGDYSRSKLVQNQGVLSVIALKNIAAGTGNKIRLAFLLGVLFGRTGGASTFSIWTAESLAVLMPGGK